MQSERNKRPRTYGTGSLFEYRHKWYAQWKVNGKWVKRVVGPHHAHTRGGLTENQANRKLAEMMALYEPPKEGDKLTFREVGERYLAHLKSVGREDTTHENYESYLRIHLYPAFGSREISTINREDVERFILAKQRDGKTPKSIRNWLGLMHGVMEFAFKRDLVTKNVLKQVEKPRVVQSPDIKHYNLEQLEALYRAIPDDELGDLERAIYMTAAMAGLRGGEIAGLRRSDVEWFPQPKIRVRQAFVRGKFTTPKSRRGARAIPMHSKLARELAQWFDKTPWQADHDLVFAHPHTGNPYDASKRLKRFQKAAKEAGLPKIPFHGLRHSFGTMMAASGTPMRTLQELMGHRDFQTTLIYADYSPSEAEADFIERAFSGHRSGIDVRATESNSSKVTGTEGE